MIERLTFAGVGFSRFVTLVSPLRDLKGPTMTDLKTAQAAAAASRLQHWVDHTHVERPTRDELRQDMAPVLDERARLLREYRELPTAEEFDRLRRNYERQAETVGKVIAERDEARRSIVKTSTAYEQVRAAYEAAEAELKAVRAELTQAEETAFTRGGWILLRLNGDGPEFADVADVQEDCYGRVVVEAYRAGNGDK